MFWNLLLQSFLRQRRRKLLAGLAIMLGIAVATAMLAIGTDVGDKISHELRAYGANIVVTPAGASLDTSVAGVPIAAVNDAAYLKEADLAKIKGIFWRHNITAFSPSLNVTGTIGAPGHGQVVPVIGTWFSHKVTYGEDQMTTGFPKTHPWGVISGLWPQDNSSANQVAVGSSLASALHITPGMALDAFGREVHVTGIVTTGGAEDHAILVPIAVAQQILGKPGAVARVDVSALTKPEDDFARKNPDALSPADRDRWFCSPYANAIARQIQEVIPNSRAEQVRQVAQNEGTVLNRIAGLMLLISLAAILSAALAVSAARSTELFERRREIGLMKALGADSSRVSTLFFTEAAVLSLFAGIAGFAIGALLARYIGLAIFGSSIAVQPILLPFVLIAAYLITLLGSANAIRKVSKVDPVLALRGQA